MLNGWFFNFLLFPPSGFSWFFLQALYSSGLQRKNVRGKHMGVYIGHSHLGVPGGLGVAVKAMGAMIGHFLEKMLMLGTKNLPKPVTNMIAGFYSCPF